MNNTWIAAASLVAMAMAVTAHAAPLPSCSEESVGDLTSLDSEDVASHRTFDIKPIIFATGDNASYQVNVQLIVNADGTVRCADLPEDDADNPKSFTVHYPESDIRAAIAQWRYEPYRDGGKPVPFSVSEVVTATHAPVKPTAMPAAAPATTSLSLVRSDCDGPCAAYSLTIHGDGRVEFDGSGTDVPGTLAYTVPAANVDALVADLRQQGLWSVQDAYITASTDASSTLLTLDIAGQRKVVRDYGGEDAGMPDTVTAAETAIDTLAGVDRWVHLSNDSLADLDALHFDYAGQAGAALLVNVIEDTESDDSTVSGLLDRHVALTGKISANPDAASSPDIKLPLDAAFESGKTGLVSPLIAAGALLKDGKPDQMRIDSAFRAAVSSADLDDAKKIGAFHPAVTYPVTVTDDSTDPSTDKTHAVSLLFLVQPNNDQAMETVRYLVSLGADVKAKDDDDATVLEKLCDNVEISKYLIGLGVDVNAKDSSGDTALLEVGNEDAALVLLDAGADATVQNDFGDTIFSQADFYEWPKVTAWLKAHKVKKPDPAP